SMIYYNLFARAYAEALGIDYDRTVEAIKEDLGVAINGVPDTGPVAAPGKKTEKPRKEPAGKPPTENNGSKLVKKLLYLFAAIVVVFVVFLVVYKFAFVSDQPSPQQPDTNAEAVETDDVVPEDTREASDQKTYDWDVEQYQKPEPIRLRLIPQNESWSTVLADGDTVIFRNLIPGRVYEAEAQYRLMVSIGIPSQVQVELNGRQVDLANAESGRISRVEINQMNLEEFFRERPPAPRPAEPSEPPPATPGDTAEATTSTVNEVSPDEY
ncbi:MAG: DUF4115 domain-containing protein, partial [Candidatus Zixiibacteriota bacterium]